MADTVEEAHPLVQTSPRPYPIVRPRTPADYEDIESLPVEEQAAIILSVSASNEDGTVDWREFASDAAAGLAGETWDETWDAMVPRRRRNLTEDETWAEAEARLRTGKVRP